jgi:phosphoglycolate phosphatase
VTQPQGALAGATIVFDLDGTLVETAPDLMGTLNALLARDGIAPLPLSDARSLIGHGAKALLAKGFATAGEPLPEARLDILFQDFLTHYLEHIADESRPFEGVVAAMDALEAQGAKLAICTNKPTHLSLALLGALGIADRFAAIVGGDATPAQKPDGRHLTLTIERAGGAPTRAVMVGDSTTDARAARNAGVPLILVSFGYTETPPADLEPDILIDHFDELPAACGRLLARESA